MSGYELEGGSGVLLLEGGDGILLLEGGGESTTTRAAFAPWRFIVTSLASETLSLLDNRSTGRRAVFTLNAPAYHEGQVGSDDPEINLAWPSANSPAFLAPNTRLIYGFQREPGASPPWVCRFGGIVMSVEDEGADVPTSRYTAYDPWQLLMARPIRFEGTPFALPGVDGLSFPAGSRASDIAAVLLAATELEDGETHIDFSDLSLIHDTDPLAAAITFDQGTSVGEAWQQLCDTGTIDIMLIPFYDPINAPGQVVKFSTWKPPNAASTPPEAGGTLRADAVMGWDRAGKSLTGISRLVDGTRLANVVQFYANQTAVPVQSDAPSIAAVGQYWAQQFFPGTGNEQLVALMAVAELAIRRNGQRSISLDPGPERTVIALRDYNLRDYVPVWSSKRLREPLAIDYTAYDPDIPSAAGYLRIHQIPIEITDDGASLVRGIMTSGRGVSSFSSPEFALKFDGTGEVDCWVFYDELFPFPATAFAEIEIYLPAATLALWQAADTGTAALGSMRGGGNSDIFMFTDGSLGDPYDKWGMNHLPTPVTGGTEADEWHTVRWSHVPSGNTATLEVDGDPSSFTNPAGFTGFSQFLTGIINAFAEGIIYIRSIKLGTTIGGSDILNYSATADGDPVAFGFTIEGNVTLVTAPA